MTRLHIMPLVLMLALTLGAPAPVWALSPESGVAIGIAREVARGPQAHGAQPAAQATDESGGLSDATKQGIGCLATSGVTVAYSVFWAGATETLMVAAGGMLVPSMAPTLWLGLASTVVAATCALGATATPVVLWAIEQKDNIIANITWQMRQSGSELAGLFSNAAKSEPRQLSARAP